MRKLIFLFPLVFLAACGLLSKPEMHPVTLYQLTPVAASSAAAPVAASVAVPTCAKVLRVRGVEASAPYADNDLLYSETPQVLGSFAWHRWATPPATMLTADILNAVAASGLYRAVLGPTDPGSADQVLAVRLDEGPLQLFSSTHGTRTSNELLHYTATLADANTGQVFGTEVFAERRAADPTPYGGVQAANVMVNDLDRQLLDWLRSEVAGSACH